MGSSSSKDLSDCPYGRNIIGKTFKTLTTVDLTTRKSFTADGELVDRIPIINIHDTSDLIQFPSNARDGTINFVIKKPLKFTITKVKFQNGFKNNHTLIYVKLTSDLMYDEDIEVFVRETRDIVDSVRDTIEKAREPDVGLDQLIVDSSFDGCVWTRKYPDKTEWSNVCIASKEDKLLLKTGHRGFITNLYDPKNEDIPSVINHEVIEEQ